MPRLTRPECFGSEQFEQVLSTLKQHYGIGEFEECCGAVIFDFSQKRKRVCLLHDIKRDTYHIPRNYHRESQSESQFDATIREAQKGTGVPCTKLKIVPSATTSKDDETEPPVTGSQELSLDQPFTNEIRRPIKGVKATSYYLLEVDYYASSERAKAGFDAQFFECDEALKKLTGKPEREVLTRAVLYLDAEVFRWESDASLLGEQPRSLEDLELVGQPPSADNFMHASHLERHGTPDSRLTQAIWLKLKAYVARMSKDVDKDLG